MKNRFNLLLLVSAFASGCFLLSSCEKDYAEPVPEPSRSFVEEFDTVSNLYAKGWVFNNNSRPQGVATWQQGVGDLPAYSYKASADEYILVFYGAGSGRATLSNWMITPEIETKNGDRFSFYTLAFTGLAPDRLQVRLNPTDNSADVGNSDTSIGKFTTLLADINPNLTATGYPLAWTKYEYTIAGLPALSKRRIAFRYYVPNGGPSGVNSYAIGIDRFEFISQ